MSQQSIQSIQSIEERIFITRGIMEIMDSWKLAPTDIHRLLNLPESIPTRGVARFREKQVFPENPQVKQRIDYLLRISDALRTYFPRNPEMRSIWLRRGDRKFGDKAPLAVMLEDGDAGFIAVLCYLDCSYAWDCTGSSANSS